MLPGIVVHNGNWTDYEWIVVCGALAAFFMAWAIGANDVGNAVGNSVGSRTLTLFQACCVAAVFEFVGAVALGGEVSSTIAGGVANPQEFQSAPEMLMYGMLCALVAAGVWVTLATYLELAISTTHTIIGAIIGFSLIWDGNNGVIWSEPTSDFPYTKGVLPLVISWFTSPLIAGLAGAVIFLLNRHVVLRQENSARRALWVFPLLVGLTVFVNLFFVLYKAAKKTLNWTEQHAAWVAAAIAAGVMVLIIAIGMPLLVHRYRRDRAVAEENSAVRSQQSSTAVQMPAAASALGAGVRSPTLRHLNLAAVQVPPNVGSLATLVLGPSGPSSQIPPKSRSPQQASGSEETSHIRGTGVRQNSNRSMTAHSSGARSSPGPVAEARQYMPLQPGEPVTEVSPRSMSKHAPNYGAAEVEAAGRSLTAGSYLRAPQSVGYAPADAAAGLEEDGGCLGKLGDMAMHGLTYDIFEGSFEDPIVVAMHASAEVFDERAERVYQYLQVFSACCVAFAHGANDVANAIGPFAAIWYSYRNWTVSSQSETPRWTLVLGGAGIVVGIATYGYNIIKVLGVKVAKMTPCRGFSAELATALTVSVASIYGLPISTTHCIVGAEAGVGLCEGTSNSVNWRLLAKTCVAWVLTLAISGLFSAALFAQGAYAPSITMYNKIEDYESYLQTVFTQDTRLLNASNYGLAPIFSMSTPYIYGPLNNVSITTTADVALLFNASKTGYINSTVLINYVEFARRHLMSYSAVMVGYNNSLRHAFLDASVAVFRASPKNST